MQSFTIDNLQVLGSGVTNYSLQTADGLEAPSFRVNNYNRPGEDGARVSSSFLGGRAVTLSGIVKADDAASFEAARQALGYACRINRSDDGTLQPTLFSFTTLDGTDYFFYGYVQQFICPLKSPTFAAWQLSLIAADPLIYYATQRTTGQIALPSGGGFVVPFVVPVTLEAETGGSVVATNSGNQYARPQLTLRGALTNPYILNQATGVWMQLDYTLGASDVVVIDMAEKTIMLNGSTPLISAKASGASWWGLLPGVNTIQFSSGANSDNGTLEVSWYDGVLGV